MSNLAFMPGSEDDMQDVSESAADWQYSLDLNRLLLPRPASTFLLCADSSRLGVRAGDIMVVDRSLRPDRGTLVVAIEEGEMRLNRFPVEEVWGVITHIVRRLI